MDLEVRHLRVVCAIAESGSLTRAAVSLHMTQPGLSAQLRRIEVMLGGAIFERGQAGVVPTPFGELVLTRARAILPGIDDLLADAARATRPQGAPDRVRLGSVGAPLLTDLVLAVRGVLPAAEVSTRCQYSPSPLLDDLAAGRMEAAVVGDNPGHELPPHDGIVLCSLVTEPVFALLPAPHPLAAEEEVSLNQLLEEVAVVGPVGAVDRMVAWAAATFAGDQPAADLRGRRTAHTTATVGSPTRVCSPPPPTLPGQRRQPA